VPAAMVPSWSVSGPSDDGQCRFLTDMDTSGQSLTWSRLDSRERPVAAAGASQIYDIRSRSGPTPRSEAPSWDEIGDPVLEELAVKLDTVRDDVNR